jgi:hypothetical protein
MSIEEEHRKENGRTGMERMSSKEALCAVFLLDAGNAESHVAAVIIVTHTRNLKGATYSAGQ